MKIFLVTGDRAYAKRLTKILGGNHQLVTFANLADATTPTAEEEIGQNLVLLDVSTRDPGKWPNLVRELVNYFRWKIVVVDRLTIGGDDAAFRHRAVGYLSKAWRSAEVRRILQNSAAARPPE